MNAYIQLVEDFINTYDTYLQTPEHLREPADLHHFLTAHHLPAPTVDAALLQHVRVLRTHLRAIWTADSAEAASTKINDLLRKTLVIPQVTDGFQIDLTLPPDAPVLTQLTVQTLLGLIRAIQQVGLERLRACAAEPCQDVFIDTSRNRSRRYCSERCANRHNIAAFRERQRD